MYSHFARILDEAFENDTHFKLGFNCGDYEAMDEHYFCGHSGIHAAAGATRVAIIDNDYDWICKFDYSEDARGSACEREYERYLAAKKFGVEDMLAEVVYLGSYAREYMCPNTTVWEYEENEDYDEVKYTAHIELYAYKKASFDFHIYGIYRNLSDEDKTLMDSRHSPLCGRNEDVGALFLSRCGHTKYCRLSDFCRNFHINDLHGGNIGLIDGYPVIIDYAGYYDVEDESSEDKYTSGYNS